MYTSTLIITCAAFLVLYFTPAMSLTADQIVLFKTTGIVESNSGVIGTVSVTTNTNTLTIISNGVPDHATSVFPSPNNPNDITEQSYTYNIPRYPTIAASTSCLPMGPIAMATNGVPIFNLQTAEGTDAMVTEVFDSCNGHPTRRGGYHYHQDPVCLDSIQGNPAGLVGVALDGFAIYGRVDENGVKLTTVDLDECHGHAPEGEEYHYHIASDYPYTLACYKGTRTAPSIGDCLFFTTTASPTTATAAVTTPTIPTTQPLTTTPPPLPPITTTENTTPPPPPPTTATTPPPPPPTTTENTPPPPTTETTPPPPPPPQTTLPSRPRPRPRPRPRRPGHTGRR